MRVALCLLNFDTEVAILEWIDGPDVATVQEAVARRFAEVSGGRTMVDQFEGPWRMAVAFDTMDTAGEFAGAALGSVKLDALPPELRNLLGS